MAFPTEILTLALFPFRVSEEVPVLNESVPPKRISPFLNWAFAKTEINTMDNVSRILFIWRFLNELYD